MHPMTALQTWHPGNHSFDRQEFSVRHHILQSMLSLYGVRPLHDGKQSGHGDDRSTQQYYFASDNARDWALVACALYGVLEKRLLTPFFDGTIPPKNMPRASMDIDSISTAAEYLDTFAVLLDLPPMKAILSDEHFTAKLELADNDIIPPEDEYTSNRGTMFCSVALYLVLTQKFLVDV